MFRLGRRRNLLRGCLFDESTRWSGSIWWSQGIWSEFTYDRLAVTNTQRWVLLCNDKQQILLYSAILGRKTWTDIPLVAYENVSTTFINRYLRLIVTSFSATKAKYVSFFLSVAEIRKSGNESQIRKEICSHYGAESSSGNFITWDYYLLLSECRWHSKWREVSLREVSLLNVYLIANFSSTHIQDLPNCIRCRQRIFNWYIDFQFINR